MGGKPILKYLQCVGKNIKKTHDRSARGFVSLLLLYFHRQIAESTDSRIGFLVLGSVHPIYYHKARDLAFSSSSIN